MKDKMSRILILIFLLVILLAMTGCGALRKAPPAIPETVGWQGPQGKIGDVRIFLSEEPTTIVLDLDTVDAIFERTYLP